jgi:hypothetical protein
MGMNLCNLQPSRSNHMKLNEHCVTKGMQVNLTRRGSVTVTRVESIKTTTMRYQVTHVVYTITYMIHSQTKTIHIYF